MVNKHMQRCLTSLSKREIPITRLQYMPFRMTKIKILTICACKDTEQRELSYIVGGDANWHSYVRKQFGSFFKT